MNLWFDIRYAWRLLTKSWGYSAMCAAVIALSVGLAVWTYALAYSQVWKPLPFAGSDRWYSIQIAADAKAEGRPAVDAFTYQELLAHNRTFDSLGAFTGRVAVLGDGHASTSLRAAAITPRLFAAMRVAPHLGRVFQDTDGQSGAAPVAILGYDAWQDYFAGDSSIIGKMARIDAVPVQIIGVMPKGFLAFRDFEMWVPLQMPRLARPADSTLSLVPIIALKDGQSPAAIAKEMQRAVERVNRDYPDLFKATRHVELYRASRMYGHGNGPIVAMIGFMAAAVLLLGGVNIGMVFLARLLERSRELALRTALGASRGRLLRQSLLETAMVVLTGLGIGYGLAAMGVEWTHRIADFLGRILGRGSSSDAPELRATDFFVAVIAATAIWLLSTLVPAWRVARRDAAAELGGSGKGAPLRASNKSVALLVGLQVVISSIVLVMCGNLVVAVDKEVGKPTGVHSARVMLSTRPTAFNAHYASPDQRLHYWNDLDVAIRGRIPGAEVAFATAPPTRPERVTATIETLQGRQKEGALTLPTTAVSDGYFALLGVTLRSGRLFDSTDNRASLPVAVVDEETAMRYWPGESAIGKRVRLHNSDNAPWLTIVGVVSAVGGRPYVDDETGVLYQSLRQAAPAEFHVLAQLPPNVADARTALRTAAYEVDRDLALHNLQTLDDYFAALNLSWTAMNTVMIAIALITAMLAASGLFGLISRSVAQRTQEVGIRRALGGTPFRATAMFWRQGGLYLGVSVAGAALGIIVTTLLSAIFSNILDSVAPVTAGVVLLMAGVIFTASYLPTRRAVALQPGDALRYE